MILRTDTPGRYEVRCPCCDDWGVVSDAADRDAARAKFIAQGWKEGDRAAAKPEDIICGDCAALAVMEELRGKPLNEFKMKKEQRHD